jgi:hypothetical protein
MAKLKGRRWTLLLTVMATVLISVPTAVWASHQFTDVPDSHIFHTGISWMKDNNITVGCNPPANTQFCPDDNVTRGQMATFMKRLADNQVVDAGALAGFSPDELVRASHAQSAAAIDDFDPGPTFTEIFSTQVEAPVDGIVIVSAVHNTEWDVSSPSPSGARTRTRMLVDGVQHGIQPWTSFDEGQIAASVQSGLTVSIHAAVPVTAGTSTVSLEMQRSAGTALLFVQSASVTTLFVPFGDSGEQGVLQLGSQDTPQDGNQ